MIYAQALAESGDKAKEWVRANRSDLLPLDREPTIKEWTHIFDELLLTYKRN